MIWVICLSDFEAVYTTTERKNESIEFAMEQPKRSLLRHNAVVLSKLIIVYSDACRDLAAFDWNSSCVFGLNDSGNTEAQEFTYFYQADHFRSLLLDMILKGLTRKSFIPS